MIEKLKKAIQLRTEKKNKESEQLFIELTTENSENGECFYHYAWLCDNMERELEAYPKYEKALKLGLNKTDLAGCYLGLGSTYRCIGEYKKSIQTLDQALCEFPDNREFKVFKAMTLHNLKNNDEAMRILLNLISETSNDKGIQSYKKAIKHYSTNLNKKFR